MPRPTRLHLPGVPQHITQRGNNRQACFYAEDDYRLYLELLQTACRNHDCDLHAYVLMTNHVHLLMTPGKADSIPLVIRDTGRDYVRSVNKAYRRTGTLWEGRYKSSLVDQARYCLTCYRYIELNPVRARMVKQPDDYPWSSYRCNARGVTNALITPHDCWLALGENNTQRALVYLALVNQRMAQDDLDHIRNSLNTGLPTGNHRFRREIESALAIRLGHGKRGRPRKAAD
jgi:putative transposase